MKQFYIQMLEKRKKKHTKNRCTPGNQSRSSCFVARHTNHKAMSSSRARLLLTRHFFKRLCQYCIRNQGKCKSFDLTELYLSVFGIEMISSDKRTIDISDTLKLLYFVKKNVGTSI